MGREIALSPPRQQPGAQPTSENTGRVRLFRKLFLRSEPGEIPDPQLGRMRPKLGVPASLVAQTYTFFWCLAMDLIAWLLKAVGFANTST
jgi:hypothetical protein